MGTIIGVKFLDFYLKVGGVPLPKIMLKRQYLIAFTDIGILLSTIPDTTLIILMAHAIFRIYARTIFENSEVNRIGYGLCVLE